MDNKGRIKIVSGIDLIYAVTILIIGILVTLMGINWIDLLNFTTTSYPYSYNPFSWMNYAPWIFFCLGISTVFYGIKKIVDDILTIIITNQEQIKMYYNKQRPNQPPIQQQRQP